MSGGLEFWYVYTTQRGDDSYGGVCLCDYHKRVYAVIYPELPPARLQPAQPPPHSCYECIRSYKLGVAPTLYLRQDDAFVRAVNHMGLTDFGELCDLLGGLGDNLSQRRSVLCNFLRRMESEALERGQ